MTYNEEMDKRSKMLLGTVVGLFLLSLVAVFVRYVVLERYDVIYDPALFAVEYPMAVSADPKEMIAADVMGCSWDTAPYLLFSDNVDSPLLYFSHLFPGVLALLVGLFIYISNRKNAVNRVFWLLSIVFFAWCIGDLIVWASEKPGVILFFWSTLMYLELLMYFLPLYLLYLFTKNKHLPFQLLLFVLVLFLPNILLNPTDAGLGGFDYTNCDREAAEGPLWYYTYALELLFVLVLSWFYVHQRQFIEDPKKKRELDIFATGLILFQMSLLVGSVVGTISENWYLAQYGIFGNVIFLVLMSYLISRFDTFNMRVIRAQIFAGMLSVSALSLLFVKDRGISTAVAVIVLCLSLFLGKLLVDSVRPTAPEQKNETEDESEDVHR